MIECDASVRMDYMRLEDHVSPALLRNIVAKKLEHLVCISLSEFAISSCVEMKKIKSVCTSARADHMSLRDYRRNTRDDLIMSGAALLTQIQRLPMPTMPQQELTKQRRLLMKQPAMPTKQQEPLLIMYLVLHSV